MLENAAKMQSTFVCCSICVRARRFQSVDQERAKWSECNVTAFSCCIYIDDCHWPTDLTPTVAAWYSILFLSLTNVRFYFSAAGGTELQSHDDEVKDVSSST